MDNELVAFFYSLPLLAAAGYISLNKDLTASPLITWIMLFVSFVLSIFCGFINFFLSSIFQSVIGTILMAFNEEFFKFTMLISFFPLYKNELDLKKTFFLGSTCCLGFAMAENIDYILYPQSDALLPSEIGLFRIIMPTPMHFITGGIIAIYSYQYFRNKKSLNNIFIGLGIATAIHSIYNIGASIDYYIMSVAVAIGIVIAFTSYKNMLGTKKTIYTNTAEKIKFRSKSKKETSTGKILSKKENKINIISKKK